MLVDEDHVVERAMSALATCRRFPRRRRRSYRPLKQRYFVIVYFDDIIAELLPGKIGADVSSLFSSASQNRPCRCRTVLPSRISSFIVFAGRKASRQFYAAAFSLELIGNILAGRT